MRCTALAAIALLTFAGSSAAQDLSIQSFPVGSDGNTITWEIRAEFLGTPPSDIVQIWADASFELFALSGSAASITIVDYNSSYDTLLGQAVISNNGSERVGFVGNSNFFFGSTDNSNPLYVMTVEVTSETSSQLCLELVGQNSAIFELAPFGDVRLYQDAQGNAGELSFEYVCIPPTPGTAAAFAVGGVIGARRRRSG
ncbi:MAG: hypothetical protein AAFN41_05140 [Planctomycetota bacterium]